MRKTLALAALMIFSLAAASLLSGCGPKDAAAYWGKKLENKNLTQEKELEMRLNYAYALDEQKRYDEALKQYDIIISKKVKKYEYIANNNKGNTLYKLERYHDALKNFEALVESRPKDSLLWNNIAHCYHGLKRYDKALEAYNKALALNPQNRPAQEGLNYLKQDMERAKTQPAEKTDEAAPAGEKAEPAATGTAPAPDAKKNN